MSSSAAPGTRCSTAATAVPIDLELGALRALVVSGPEHGRQDRGAEDARPRGRAPPVRAPSAGGRGGAARLRRDPGRHRRRAVDRDEPLHVLGPRAEPRRDHRAARRRGRSSSSTSSRPAPTPSRAPRWRRPCSRGLREQARLTVATSHYAELKEWASAAEGAANAATGLDPETNEPLYTLALGRAGHVARAADRRAARAPAEIVEAARGARSRPSGCRWPSSSPRPRPRPAGRRALRRRGRSRREAEAARAAAERAEEELRDEIEAVRASAAGRAARALARPRRSCGDVRAELDDLRARSARRGGWSAAGRAATPVAREKERQRDRRLGAAAERAAARPARSLGSTSRCRWRRRSLPATRWWRRRSGAWHDRRDRRRRGDRARQRRAARQAAARPTAAEPGAGGASAPEPAVTVRAMVQNDIPDELDLRGRTAQEASEAVRDLVDRRRSRAAPRCG